MSKVIKKSVDLKEPVVIGNNSSDVIPSKNSKTAGKENRQSLAFTEVIKSEIGVWTEKATQQVRSQNQLHSREIEQAYQKGYEKGLASGIKQEREDRIKAVDMLLKEAKKKSREAIRGLEIKVIELVAAIAEKVIRKSIADDTEIVVNIIDETMSYIIGSETVILKVSPEDFKTINEKYDRWLSMAGSAREFRIEIDKRLKRGDCLVETEGGIIDSVISNRIDVLVEELLKVSK